MRQDEKSELILDKEGGLRRVGGDHEIYNELMDMFMDNSITQIEQLKQAVKNKESEIVKRLAHSIKGAAANLGILKVQKSAFELEQIGGDSRIDDVEYSLKQLIYELDRVKQYWHSY